jgi:hypothetical protein
MICNLSNANEIIHNEKLDLLVVSYGGSCSNILVDTLEKTGYKCRSTTWDNIFCHCPTYIEVDIPIIYIYDNPIKSFLSVRNRGKGYWDINQKKLSNNNNIELSDENLFELMIRQFYSWTKNKYSNVLLIETNELFDINIVYKLENFLKKKIKYFPIQYVKPKTDISDIKEKKMIELFEKYKIQIDYINNYK